MTEDPAEFVTIGIPFFNAEKTLPGAIRSVFAQTYQNWELILVDDGSTDRSLEIARSVDDPRVRVISDGRNLKLPARLNQIVREAKYGFVARMDADDLVSPVRIERQMRILAARPELDLVSTGVFSLDDDDHLVGVRWADVSLPTQNDVVWKPCICHASVIGRKEWFLRNPYDESFFGGQDLELWQRTAAKGDLKIYVVREPLYYYREAGSCSTFRKTMRRYKNMFITYRRYGRRLLGSNWGYLKLIATHCLRIAAVTLLFAVGGSRWRQRRRNRKQPVDGRLRKTFEREMEEIWRTRVPGLG